MYKYFKFKKISHRCIWRLYCPPEIILPEHPSFCITEALCTLDQAFSSPAFLLGFKIPGESLMDQQLPESWWDTATWVEAVSPKPEESHWPRGLDRAGSPKGPEREMRCREDTQQDCGPTAELQPTPWARLPPTTGLTRGWDPCFSALLSAGVPALGTMDGIQGVQELGWKTLTSSISLTSKWNLIFRSIMNTGNKPHWLHSSPLETTDVFIWHYRHWK